MCGIVGVVSHQNFCRKTLLQGLTALEYRGYDSWGVAVLVKQKAKRLHIDVHKAVGAVSESQEGFGTDKASTHTVCGIAHTRWATHGGVDTDHAHPHVSRNGEYAVVHNGILEKWRELATQFALETDSDTAVLTELIARTGVSRSGVQKSLAAVTGRNAWCVLSKRGLVACSTGAPLLVGRSADGKEVQICSDLAAFSAIITQYTVIPPGGGVFVDLSAQLTWVDSQYSPSWRAHTTSAGEVENRNRMKLEMYQQPAVLEATCKNTVQLEPATKLLHKAKRIYCLGAGSAYFAAGFTAHHLRIAGKDAIAVPSNEWSSWERLVSKEDCCIAISQSGETADTNAIIEHLNKANIPTIALVNVTESSLARMVSAVVGLEAGPERAVASTKAFTTQCLLGVLLAKQQLTPLSDASIEKTLTAWMNSTELSAVVSQVAHQFQTADSVFCIGTDAAYWLAQEWALKLKEIGYVHAEALSAGELKHGVLALIEEAVPVVGVVPAQGAVRAKTLTALEEIKSRGGYILGVSDAPAPVFDTWISIPPVPHLAEIHACIPAQLIAYECAVQQGRNPDKPRNLAKCVTVH